LQQILLQGGLSTNMVTSNFATRMVICNRNKPLLQLRFCVSFARCDAICGLCITGVFAHTRSLSFSVTRGTAVLQQPKHFANDNDTSSDT
jgi:hypothetical protein